MSSLKSTEKRLFEHLFEMRSGYVLDFTNDSFAEVFREFNIDIYSNEFNYESGSKAKRLKFFWEKENDIIVGKILNSFLDHWEIINSTPTNEDKSKLRKCREIANNLTNNPKSIQIIDITRRKIFEEISISGLPWCGDLTELEFLKRLYDLKSIQSYDYKFRNIEDEIVQHRYLNDAFDYYWIFHDKRFDLLCVNNEEFLSFLCEMVHPAVQSNERVIKKFIVIFNKYLKPRGWIISKGDEIEGKPIYIAQQYLSNERIFELNEKVIIKLSSDYVNKQIERMHKALNNGDADLAIGTSKEFIETISKSILEMCGETYENNESLQSLVGKVRKRLRILPDNISERTKGFKSIKSLLGSLANIVQRISEIRNLYGSGHGKKAKTSGLEIRQAKLAVGASITLGSYLFETYQKREFNENK